MWMSNGICKQCLCEIRTNSAFAIFEVAREVETTVRNLLIAGEIAGFQIGKNLRCLGSEIFAMFPAC